ncbi:MAG: metal-dependent hydrolase [Candidatus Woesearchaeota archaeon]
MTDNFTHTLFVLFIGVILIPLLNFKGRQKLAYIAVLLAGNAPDIDIIIRAFGAGLYLTNHRVLTHSMFGILALALILTIVFSFFLKQKDYWKYFVLIFTGIMAHVFLDVITAFGTLVMYPFNYVRYSFSIIPIIDIYVLAIFLVGLWFLYIQPNDRAKVAKATLFIFLIFLLFKTGLHAQAVGSVTNIQDYKEVSVVSHFLNPFGWRTIVREPDYYLISDFDLTIGGFKEFKYYPIVGDGKLEASKKSLIVRQFLEFSHSPYALVENNTVKWVDLRLTTDKLESFTAKVQLDDNNNIIYERLGI